MQFVLPDLPKGKTNIPKNIMRECPKGWVGWIEKETKNDVTGL